MNLQIRLDKIESCWPEFNDIQLKIEDKCLDKIEEGDDTEEKCREEFENKYFEVVSLARQIIQTTGITRNTAITENVAHDPNVTNCIFPSRSSDTTPNTSSLHIRPSSEAQNVLQVKYPEIKLPLFNGSYDEWLSFYDTFNSLIHNNAVLSDIEKFHYLKSCLRNEAAQVIKSLEISSANYIAAWNLLKDRFLNTRLIINNHVRGLHETPALAKESSTAIRQLLDNTITHLRALESLNQPINQWDTLIIYIVTNKLDSSTRRSWESSIQKHQIPKWQDLTNFLTTRAQILESMYGSYTNNKQTTRTDQNTKSRIHSSYMVNNKIKCPHCKNQHFIYQCEEFKKLSVNDRIKEVKRMKLCFNCLRNNHIAGDCRSTKCKECNENHNTLLHPTNVKTESNASLLTSNTCQRPIKNILLSTAVINLKDNNGKLHECRALLDSGSHINFITNNLCNRLKLTKTRISQTITGINQRPIEIGYRTKTTIRSRFNSFLAELDFLLLENITENLPPQNIDTRGWKIPDTIQLADPKYNKSLPVDILIGSELFWNLFCVGQISLGKNRPILQKTKLGWIMAGPIGSSIQNNLTCNLSLQDLNSKIERFWILENQPMQTTKQLLSPEEQMCEKHFVENTCRNDDGRFVVKLPLKVNRETLGNSKETALKRFKHMENKLNKAPELKKQYHEFMQEYISLGHMRETTKNEDAQDVHFYLPHHSVLKADSVTTKLRIVFDGSCKSDSGLSLNDIMMVGATVQPDLFTILIQFRLHHIVVIEYVEKMYRMVKVHEEDTNLQRVLWRFSSNKPIKSYNLLTVTYGTASASFLATRCLLRIADDISSNNQAISKIIKESFYVDDLLTGFDSVNQALHMRQELQNILKSYGFNLRKWCSNNAEVTSNISSTDEQHQVIALNKQDTVKTLGLVWNPMLDIFQYTIKDNDKGITKRSILSSIASIFDPLGLLEPVTIISKMLLQEIWQQGIGWDETLPMNLHTTWEKYKRNLHILNTVKIDRYVMTINESNHEIHGFSDASEQAYGACIYIKSGNNSRLLCAKSRVAPLKQTTIPRLELCAAHLLARLYAKIASIIKVNTVTYLWTDSMIVLAWLKGSPNQWQTFVQNRVSQIQELTNTEDWRHVKSQENPADMLSRGLQPEHIKTSELWWHGPQWLQGHQQIWPAFADLPEDIPEQRISSTRTFMAISEDSIFRKYSSLTKLQRVVAYILRFTHNSRKPPEERITGFLKVEELKKSLNTLLIIAQKETFPAEYDKLESHSSIKGSSKLASLNPFIAKDGLIRLGGRLKNANLNYDNKYPIILEPNHTLTKLIITYEHLRLMHAGCQATLASLRTRYWPLSGKCSVKRIIRNCVTCFRAKPILSEYIMGNLPEERVTPTRPFLSCGVDYAGPFYIKEGGYRSKKLIKTYLCLFVCLSTKAVHLELSKDLSTQAFLNCLRRFISRRGKCHSIFSDNGTNFIGAKNQLKELGTLLKNNNEAISDELSKQCIQWHMIPPRSPHFGGLWEAAVKSAKYHLTRIVGNASLTYEELNTIIVQIEGCLNSRPISPLSNDPNDLTPLTPAHFLIGDSLQTLSPADYPSEKTSFFVTLPTTAASSKKLLEPLVQRLPSAITSTPEMDPSSAQRSQGRCFSHPARRQPATPPMAARSHHSNASRQ